MHNKRIRAGTFKYEFVQSTAPINSKFSANAKAGFHCLSVKVVSSIEYSIKLTAISRIIIYFSFQQEFDDDR